MKVSRHVQAIINAAYHEAKVRSHEYLTPEHILYAALAFTDVQGVLSASGASVDAIKNGMEAYFEQKIPVLNKGEPASTVGFQLVIERAVNQCKTNSKTELDMADLLMSLYDEERNYSAYYLRKAGIHTRDDLAQSISQGHLEDDDSQLQGAPTGPAGDPNAEDTKKKKTALERYCVELVTQARQGLLEPVVGRQEEIERTIQVLLRRKKNNPVHVGDAGVGKTAITEGLAEAVSRGAVPESLKNVEIYSLDTGTLVAGAKMRGELEERTKRLFDEITKKPNAILYIDEIHTIIGRSWGGESVDVSSMLKTALSKGSFRCIGATTYEEYNHSFEKEKALARRFQKIDIEEPTKELTFDILQGLKDEYEKHHQVTYTDEALRAAASLSAQYIQDRKLPDKAIDIIDEAGVLARKMAQTDANTENKGDDTTSTGSGTVTPAIIETVVAKMAHIPEKTVGKSEKERLAKLESSLKEKVFGQNEAVEQVAQAVKLNRAGFHGENKPAGAFLFVGPTGVGKTELAKQLAESLGIALHRFDMSEYQEPHSVSRFVGSPPGYIGYDEGGLLTGAIIKQPNAVLLLDEIEKAHPDIYNMLLQIMDYATLTDNSGRKADFRHIIIIMTSNAGAGDIGKPLIGFGERTKGNDAALAAVEKTFQPEFRNRLDAVIPFKHLSHDIMENIVRKELQIFRDQLHAKNIGLKVTDAAISELAQESYSTEFGARNTSRLIETKIKAPLVNEVLFHTDDNNEHELIANVDWNEDDGFITRLTTNNTNETRIFTTNHNLFVSA
ncbi:MAG: ATP-dependent Clp protease ATP-binding subunit [Spirochaetaceae bacterium]|jgi:ATP-dependent Clp protease ATP-binding subunit ClpA|nr:ATP-dependent Clp protease ATP-binding subunit [Spirochaetaceae bacterium]